MDVYCQCHALYTFLSPLHGEWISLLSILFTCRRSYSRLLVFLKNTDTEMSIDSRMYTSVIPSPDILAAACATVRTPRGDSYTFAVDMTAMGRFVTQSTCYQQAIASGVLSQDMSYFEGLFQDMAGEMFDAANEITCTVMEPMEYITENGLVP